MSPSSSRFILAGAVIGLARVSFSIGKKIVFTTELLDTFPNSFLPAFASLKYVEAAMFGCAVLGIGWLLIWWREVNWSVTRLILTVASIAWSTIPAIGIMLYAEPGWPSSRVYLAAICWASCWIASTALIWRSGEFSETASLAGAVPCPQCGYDLRGQRNTQCPECGRAYQLGEIAPVISSAQAEPFRSAA
jgi:hypothetical protein